MGGSGDMRKNGEHVPFFAIATTVCGCFGVDGSRDVRDL